MRFKLFIVLVPALALSSCDLVTGPSGSAAGNWRAPGIGHNGQHFDLSLTQNGDDISGQACGSETGVIFFTGAPVSGDLSAITFVVPQSGRRFTGKFEDDRDQIAGELESASAPIPLRFVRSEVGLCAGSKPLP